MPQSQRSQSQSQNNSNKTPQDKHKMSAFTAAQDLEYSNYRNKMYAMGEEPLAKREWYNKIYKKGRNKGD